MVTPVHHVGVKESDLGFLGMRARIAASAENIAVTTYLTNSN
jgi:hypothetical protein